MRRSFMLRPIVVVALIAPPLFAACGGPVAGSPPASPPTTGTPSPAASAPADADSPAPSDAGTPLSQRLEAEIAVEGSPDWPLAAFGSIWVLAPDLPIRTGEGTPNLVRIDPATNGVLATIVVPDRLCQGFVASDDDIWVCAVDALHRIDPATNEIASSVPIKGAQRFYKPAFGDGMVWALGSTAFAGDTVIRLDPASEATTSFQMPASIGGLAYAFDALWLTSPGEGTLVRMDPATGETEVLTTGLMDPTAIFVGSDSLWVTLHGSDGMEAGAGDVQLVRIDPAGGAVLAEFAIGGSPRGGVEVWAGEDGVLVRSTLPWMIRIDPVTNEIVETVTHEPAVHGPLTVAFDSIWTISIERDFVYRIRP